MTAQSSAGAAQHSVPDEFAQHVRMFRPKASTSLSLEIAIVPRGISRRANAAARMWRAIARLP
eukprot:7858637-Pyramimonas_sp.AAC.1